VTGVKLVATMMAVVDDRTTAQILADAEQLQVDLRRIFQDRFGGAVSVRIGLTPDHTWETLADLAKTGAIETLGRMSGGDLRIHRFIQTDEGKKEF
jgi:hypothetical protein